MLLKICRNISLIEFYFAKDKIFIFHLSVSQGPYCLICSKDYLHEKLITSENVVLNTQFKNFFIPMKTHIPFLRYSVFYILSHSLLDRSRPFLIYQPIKIKTSYDEFGLLLFWSCEMTQSKKCKHLKITRLQYAVILSKSWKGLELVSSRRNRVKDKLKMFVIRCINIWTNFTLILHMALNKPLTV